jgi:hypothetical protein
MASAVKLPALGTWRSRKCSNRTVILVAVRFICFFGAFSSIRLAFASARFLISALIFSIKVRVSDV